MLISFFLRKFLKNGTLVIIGPRGTREIVHATDSPRVTIRFTNRLFPLKLLLSPNFYLAEGYVTGDLQIEQGDLRDLLTMLMTSMADDAQPTLFDKARKYLGPLLDSMLSVGSLRRATRHVQFHYDLSNEFFNLFLDQNMQYSCAYFNREDLSLDQAQLAKMRHLAAKMLLAPGQRVLDIGSGWGALAAFLNAHYDVDVSGITLSKKQCSLANSRYGKNAVRFALRDYRVEQGSYDRIVSVGMLEHVGKAHYLEFFNKIQSLLTPDGIAVVHTIGRRGPPIPINIWIRRRIFPGAYLPSLSQLAAAAEHAHLWVLDCENWRLHYARTLEQWGTNLRARRDAVIAEFGEEFYRAWEFYLISCELGFRYQGLTVYQLILGKTPDAMPLTRDFMFDEEQRLSATTPRKTRAIA
jgi:cyclopropane-fatty-acyl-phospholipid synthase